MLVGKSHKVIPALKPIATQLTEAFKMAQELVVAVPSENKGKAIDCRDKIFLTMGSLDKFALEHAKEGV